MSLPDPGDVYRAARAVAERTADLHADPGALNVVVAGEPTAARAKRTVDGYGGPGAGDLGRLAAAVAAVDGSERVRLVQPTTTEELTAAGAWIVLEPLAGRIATVATGTARVTVGIAVPTGSVDAELVEARDRIGAVIDAARPTHEHYSVERDEAGVFTTGMATFSFAGVDDDDGGFRMAFDVRTTPATTPASATAGFSEREGVYSVEYEPGVGVERASPRDELRAAVEAAHETVRGDWEYEWLPEPTVFSRIPTAAKLALGTGAPSATTFTDAEYDDCVALLRETVEGVEAGA